MVNRKLLITISFWFLWQLAFSQKESNVWHFGANAGIDFNTGKPLANTKGKMNASEGCATQSDKNGKLLFYTDGVSVWDSSHQLMPNGSALKGNASSTQSAIIIPKPFSFKKYYIFTIDNVGGQDGLTYSEVDMSQHNGKGDIILYSKNRQLTSSVCEKVTCIKHANGYDYWLLVHKFNSDLLYAYRITKYGVLKWPVISKTGLNISGLYTNTLGYMKISPDGRKIAYNNYELDTSVIADFNNHSGKINRVWTFHMDDAYGLEFSPKSQYLYISESGSKKIYQYDAKAFSEQEFIASKTIIDSNYSNTLGALQLASDGKIYISVTGSSYLQVIQSPDSVGFKTHPKKNFVYLNGKSCGLGLPNFSPSIFNRKSFTVIQHCLNDSALFTINNTNDLDSVRWNFGDPSSGSSNTSKQIKDVFHIYRKTGIYNVSLIYFYKKTIGIATNKFVVGNSKPFLGNDTAFCNSFSLKIGTEKDYLDYRWNNQETTKSITAKKSGSYILMVTDSSGCKTSDTLIIKNAIIKAAFTVSDSIQCFKNNVFAFNNTSESIDDSIQENHWDFGDGTQLSANHPSKEFQKEGIYLIKLSVSSINGCESSISKRITVLSNPIAAFDASSPCFPESVQFVNQSKIPSGKIIANLWDFGDKTTSLLSDPNKYYNEPNRYNVKLSVISDNGCVDSILKHRGVRVKEKPSASFNFSEVSQLSNGKRILQFNNLSSNDVTIYQWDFGKGRKSTEQHPTLNYIDTGMNFFSLTVSNDLGCKDTFGMTTFHKFYFYLPDAFSPDGNQINETFGPVSSIFVNSYKMSIFNQWGEKLFETADLSNGWDGNYKGEPAPQGVYYYEISIIPVQGAIEHYKGSVRLFR